MSAGAPWSVKGIDPKAREVAKDLARRSGMTLGEWLNRVILEDDLPDEVAEESQISARVRRPVHEPPRLRAISPPGPPAGADLSRIAEALERLTDRIEASETRTGLAINGVEHTVRQALGRIDTAERQQVAFAQRIDRLEAVGPRSPEALKALEARIAAVPAPEVVVEAVLRTLGERLAAAEARTGAAVDGLRTSLAALEGRLVVLERGPAAQAEARLEALADTLSQRLDAARAEIAERLSSTAGAEVEARLAAMAEHVRAAETRAARAVEEMGRQVLAMAEAVSRRLAEVDERSAEAIDQVGTEVARIAGAVELRLARAEQTQAEAFERLTYDLARNTDRLAERLAGARPEPVAPASSIDPSEPELKPEPKGAALAPEPWPAPEALLAAARQRFEADLGDRPEPEPEATPSAAAFGPELFSRAEADVGETKPERAAFGAESFAPLAECDDEDEDIFEAKPPAAPEPDTRPLSTREVIEQARAAARAQQAAGTRAVDVQARGQARGSGRLFDGFGTAARPKPSRRQHSAMQTALMIAGGAAFLSVGAAGLTLMQGPEAAEKGPGVAGSEARRAAMAIASPATQSPAPAPSYETVRADVEAGRPKAVGELVSIAEAGHPQAQLYLAHLYEAGEAGLEQSLAEARRWTERAAVGGDPKAMHNLGVYFFRGDGGPQDLSSAAQWFRKAASVGVVESQYNLGLLYGSGSGVKKDLVEARRWFLRAAARGDDQAKAAADALASKPRAMAARPHVAAKPEPSPSKPDAAPSANTPKTQAVLARLGYYDGPIDGRDTPEYRAALAAYQRDTLARR